MDSTSVIFRSHTALLLAAALPYLQPAYRHPAELALKFLEFSETMKLYREFSPHSDVSKAPPPKEESGIFGLISRFVCDPEGLLKSLSTICTGKESEIIGMLLNLLQAKSFYETYGDVLQSFMSSATPDTPDAQPVSPDDSPDTSGFTMPDMDSILSGGDLTSMLSPEQNDTLNLLKSLLDAE